MAKDDNNPKTASQEQADNTAVTQEPVDKNAPFSLEEAQQVLEAEEGNIEAEIEKLKGSKDTDIAPDLKELKEKQVKAKQEIKQKKEEIVEIKEETPTDVTPSKFAGKSEEERLKIYLDMEKGYTTMSQKQKELEQKVKELEVINAKIDEYEKSAVVKDQQTIKSNLPLYPPDELYYDDPIKYNKQVKAYNDAVLKAAIDPLYGQNYGYEKKKVIDALKEKTKDRVIPYSEIEAEVEAHLKKNPELFDIHKLKAREVVYGEIVAERLPDKVEDIKKKAVEEAKKELKEEEEDLSSAQIMSSDITTLKRASKPVDFAEQLDSGVDPQKIQEAIKKKYNIRNEF